MQRSEDQSATGAASVLEFLSGSENRVRVLRALRERGRLDRYELEETLDATRRTLLRTIDALEEHGYVATGDDGIGLTALGEHVVEAYEAFAEEVALEPSVESVLASVPAEALAVAVPRLRDAEVTAAGPGSPYAPLDRSLELRAEATEIRELAPGIERRSVEQLAERVESDDEVSAEIVVTEAVLAAAEEVSQYTDAHETVLAADAVDLAVHPGPFAVSLGVADDVVFLIAEDGEGQPKAILESDDPEVRRWANDVIDRHRAAARPVSPE